jgi:hypothetical protein
VTELQYIYTLKQKCQVFFFLQKWRAEGKIGLVCGVDTSGREEDVRKVKA